MWRLKEKECEGQTDRQTDKLGNALIGNVAELGAEAQEQLELARPSPRMSSPLPLQHSAGAAAGSQQAPNSCPSSGSAARGPEIAAT